MAKHKSSLKISRRRRDRRASKRRTESRPALDFDALLGDLSDAIAVCATASNSLVAAQEKNGRGVIGDRGDDITTLQFGVRHTLRAFEALETAVESRCDAKE